MPHQQLVHNNNHNHGNANASMESSTIIPSESTFNRLSYGRNRIRKKQPRTNPNYVNIEIKSNDGSLRSTYIRIHDTQKSKTTTLSSSSSSSSSSSAKHASTDQDSIVCNAHFHSQPYLNDTNEYFTSNDTLQSQEKGTPTKKSSSHWIKNNEERNELIMQQNDPHHQNEDAQTLTNKTALMMKQFVTCNDGKYAYRDTHMCSTVYDHRV